MSLGCPEQYQAFVYERGGLVVVGELPLSRVRWRRRRDDISDATVDVPTETCCEWIGAVETVRYELHIFRNGLPVWEGVITRLEYEFGRVNIHASDMLWAAKRTALESGYDHSAPNTVSCGWVMEWLLNQQCYSKYGDPWNMLSHIHRIIGSDDPQTSRSQNPYQKSVWEDFDDFARYSGMDYGVVGRDVYFFDTHLAWNELPPLDASDLAEWPTIVEYGNELATRAFTTNNQGFASVAVADQQWLDHYGHIDFVTSSANEATQGNDAPTPAELEAMLEQSERELQNRVPAPVRLRMKENNQLLESAPWDIADMIPGSWFELTSPGGMCREMSEWHKLDAVNVLYAAGHRELVQISSLTAPSLRVDP